MPAISPRSVGATVCTFELARRQQEAHWLTRINNALEEDLFSLILHPVLALNGRVPGDEESQRGACELQLRMLDEHGRELPAAVFLPAAERYHIAAELDLWALEHTLRWLGEDSERIRALEHCCVDLTAASLRDDDFVTDAVVVLKKSGVPADRICFGLPESILLDGNSASSRFVDCMREIGAHLSVTGFGTGQSVVRAIAQLPVDSLKLHPDIVTGKQSVAPCVETSEALEVLTDLGVEFAVAPGIGKSRAIDAPRKRVWRA